MKKKLYRSRSDYNAVGVCGGIAEYLGVNSTFIRVLWLLSCGLLFTGVVAYFLCWLLIPLEPDKINDDAVFCAE